jgi:aminomethyltransferase
VTSTPGLKQTVLHPFHLQSSANMAEFGGYHMPLWYPTGAKAEHLAVIQQAGLFDTSHMAVLTVEGDGSLNLLQHCFSRDLQGCVGGGPGPLTVGRSVYGLFLKNDGRVLDDAIISQLGPERYMIVVNSGMGAAVSAHLKAFAETDVAITDYTDRLAKIDLQGPAAALIMEKLLAEPDAVLGDLTYFSFKGDIFSTTPTLRLTDGIPVLLSRTGYTGEFGFELLVEKENGPELLSNMLAAGKPFGLLPCGLAARDSLRAGALLPLSHQDIGDWVFGHTPWSFVLPWNSDRSAFTKSFVGAAGLLTGERDFTYAFAGYDPRKIQNTTGAVVEEENGTEIGTITTCTTDMAIGRVDGRIVSIATPVSSGRPDSFRPRGLSCGFIRTARPCRTGETVLLVEGRRSLKVEIRDDIRPERTARCSMKQMRNRA